MDCEEGLHNVCGLNSWRVQCLLVAVLLKCRSLNPCPFFGIQGAADADVGKQVGRDGVKGEGGQTRTTCHLRSGIQCLTLQWHDAGKTNLSCRRHIVPLHLVNRR